MIPAFRAGLSGLAAYSTKLNSNANNIANSQSEGFKKTRVTLSDVDPIGVKTNVEKVETAGDKVYERTSQGMELIELSNVDIAEEFTDMSLNSNTYKANIKSMQIADSMLESVLDIKA